MSLFIWANLISSGAAKIEENEKMYYNSSSGNFNNELQ